MNIFIIIYPCAYREQRPAEPLHSLFFLSFFSHTFFPSSHSPPFLIQFYHPCHVRSHFSPKVTTVNFYLFSLSFSLDYNPQLRSISIQASFAPYIRPFSTI